ncbi:hypothetical protein RB593_009249 [Gaeumannomyces tritici]
MKQYTETEIACALEGVRAGASVKSASKTWGIPRSTLRRRIGGGLPSCRAQAHRQRVDPSQELFLADWVLVQIALGYPPTHGELRYIASRTLEQGGDPQALGKRWVARFLARYPILKTQRARRIENARVNGASTEVIRAWWPRLEVPAVKAIKPENRYNLDECGLMEGLGSNGLVLGIRGCKPLQKKAFGTRGWTTIIECISATGKALDPLVIFKGLSVQKQWFPLEDQERFKPWRFHATQKGWTDDKTGVKWLEDIFLPNTVPATPGDRRLLVLDGHGSHATEDFMYLYASNNVQLVYLPARSSHVLQPLDLAVFNTVKEAYRRHSGFFAAFCTSTVIGKRHFLNCYHKAREEALIPRVIKAGWAATGLWPLRISKPLMSPLLLENSNAKASQAAKDALEAERVAQNTYSKYSMPFDMVVATPKTTLQMRTQVATFAHNFRLGRTARLLFQKLTKAYNEKDIALVTCEQKTRRLEAELEVARPLKRKKVLPDLNEAFVRIGDIRRAQQEDGDLPSDPPESPASDDSDDISDCIVVG